MFFAFSRNRLSTASRPVACPPGLRRSRRNALSLERLEERCLLSVFTVTSPDDEGAGSLRQAIRDANANPGMDTIAFNIGDGGVQMIRPKSALPDITDPVVLDGTTQPGFMGSPLIVLDGTTVGFAAGLTITAGGSTIRGFVIQAYYDGIVLRQGPGNLVTGNYFGTDVSGREAAGMSLGVSVGSQNNTIGGVEAGAGNLIAARAQGVLIASNNNVVRGNRIGTDATGTRALGEDVGVWIFGASDNVIGGTAPGARNLISGNRQYGILIDSASQGPGRQASPSVRNTIQGNFIGTDITGTQALGNGMGILLSAQAAPVGDSLIGGMEAGAGNLISGNASSGILLQGSSDNLLQGNFIGTDARGTQALGNHAHGIDISAGTNNQIGGAADAARNLISGNISAGVHLGANGQRVLGNWIGTDSSGAVALPNVTGIRIDSANNTIGGTAAGSGNLISGNVNYGLVLAGRSNLVQGNFIGTDATGTRAVRNIYGVYVGGGSDNQIGGVESGASNLISGNFTGVVIVTGTGNAVQGNQIGTDVSAAHALGNIDGIVVVNASNTLIGGAIPGAGNVISGNTEFGVNLFSSGNRVQGNRVGTDGTGMHAVSNPTGIHVAPEATHNTIGGTEAGAGNVISGNGVAGVVLSGSGNLLQGNEIGTDATGAQGLANSGMGVRLEGTHNTIGGTAPAARNLISGNDDGIRITGRANVIQGNFIGTDITGTQRLPNGYGINGGSDTLIGGTEAGAGNVISGNAAAGIAAGSGNCIQGNFIGTDFTGTRRVPNNAGIVIVNAFKVLIGGTEPGSRNLISGNAYEGILINGPRDNRIQGNYIGTDITGLLPLPNSVGVSIVGAEDNTIGGREFGAGNVISGNTVNGILLMYNGVDPGSNQVQGNYIGSDISGTRALPNAIGVYLEVDRNDRVGGMEPGAGNLISGNTSYGVNLHDSTANVVQGNIIGADRTGTVPLGNSVGIFAFAGVSNNTIGGTAAGAGNLISGNRGDGVILLSPESNRVQGNRIGTDVTGLHPLPNDGNGLLIGAVNLLVGGTVGGAGNTIAFNRGDGIQVTDGFGNTLRQNSIFDNDGLGIELLSGSNRRQAAPTLTAASSSGSFLSIQGRLVSTANTTFTVELFANTQCDPSGFGEGERFLASFTVTTSTAGTAGFQVVLALSVDVGQFMTATATDPRGNTSAFSNCAEVTLADPPAPGAASRGGMARLLLSVAGSDALCLWSMVGRLGTEARTGSVEAALLVQPDRTALFAAVSQQAWRPGPMPFSAGAGKRMNRLNLLEGLADAGLTIDEVAFPIR